MTVVNDFKPKNKNVQIRIIKPIIHPVCGCVFFFSAKDQWKSQCTSYQGKDSRGLNDIMLQTIYGLKKRGEINLATHV